VALPRKKKGERFFSLGENFSGKKEKKGSLGGKKKKGAASKGTVYEVVSGKETTGPYLPQKEGGGGKRR